jgi:flagellar protein FlaG
MDIAAVTSRLPGQAAQAPAEALTREQLKEQRELIQAVKKVDAGALFGSGNELTFVFDRETRRALVRVVDRSTREVVFQIPAEEVLRRAAEK